MTTKKLFVTALIFISALTLISAQSHTTAQTSISKKTILRMLAPAESKTVDTLSSTGYVRSEAFIYPDPASNSLTTQSVDKNKNVMVYTKKPNYESINYLIGENYYYSSKPEYYTDSQQAKAIEKNIDLSLPWAFAPNFRVQRFSPTFINEDIKDLHYFLLDIKDKTKVSFTRTGNTRNYYITNTIFNTDLTIEVTNNFIRSLAYKFTNGNQVLITFKPSNDLVTPPSPAISFEELIN